MKPPLISLAQRSKVIEYLFELARKQDFQKLHLQGQGNDDANHRQNDLSFILDVIIDFLDDDARRIINNDYKQKANRQWWESYYSKTTYYRLKAKATAEFLSYLKL